MLSSKKLKDGIFFFVLGIALAVYSVVGYNHSFNKDISQSPYLFPFVISVFFVILSCSLMYQGIKLTMPEESDTTKSFDFKSVIVVLVLSVLYYLFLSWHPIPFITIGFVKFTITIANFEIATLLYLFSMLFYLGIRKIPVLLLVPILTPILLSVTFRTMLHVMLP